MPLSTFDSIVHRAHTALWTITRVALLIWGVLNGLGTVLIGRVERAKQRISRRVQRVSGTISL